MVPSPELKNALHFLKRTTTTTTTPKPWVIVILDCEARMLVSERKNMSSEQVSMNKCFWNLLLTSTKYLKNII
jgi:hypothetical protein